MAEWSKDHGAAIGSLKTQHFGLLAKTWLNGDWVGPLGKSGDSWLGRSGSAYVASRHLQGCSPRLCRLRTVQLAPASKYWTYRSHAGDMGPVSLVVDCQHELTFPHSSLVVVEEKLGMNPWIEWPSCCRLCREPFFSGAVELFKSVDDCMKGCYMLTTWDTYGRGPYTDWAWKACGVLVGFSPAGCT
jgi:hypothetical protein